VSFDSIIARSTAGNITFQNHVLGWIVLLALHKHGEHCFLCRRATIPAHSRSGAQEQHVSLADLKLNYSQEAGISQLVSERIRTRPARWFFFANPSIVVPPIRMPLKPLTKRRRPSARPTESPVIIRNID
jgi:hypothetical protein